jgi:hypothetical protein
MKIGTGTPPVAPIAATNGAFIRAEGNRFLIVDLTDSIIDRNAAIVGPVKHVSVLSHTDAMRSPYINLAGVLEPYIFAISDYALERSMVYNQRCPPNRLSMDTKKQIVLRLLRQIHGCWNIFREHRIYYNSSIQRKIKNIR